MCTYITSTVEVAGMGLGPIGEEWLKLNKAVVYFDHPQASPLEHALCIDFWDDEGNRVAIELDPESARRLVETVTSTLEAQLEAV